MPPFISLFCIKGEDLRSEQSRRSLQARPDQEKGGSHTTTAKALEVGNGTLFKRYLYLRIKTFFRFTESVEFGDESDRVGENTLK